MNEEKEEYYSTPMYFYKADFSYDFNDKEKNNNKNGRNKGAPYPPKTHDLLYLAEKLNLELTEEQEVILNEITTFNLSTRYDDYKRAFYYKCTDEYTEEQINKIKKVKACLEIMLK